MSSNATTQPEADGNGPEQIQYRSGMNTLFVKLCAICCLPSVLFAIAVILVVSLIPLYMSSRAVAPVTYEEATIFALNYATNYKGNSAIKVSNEKAIISQLEQALNLETEISSLITMRFSSSGTVSNVRRKKRQINLQQCDRKTTLDGNPLSIQFGVQIPKRFRFHAIRTQFLKKIENTIRNVRTRFLLLITTENGESVTVELEFCSLKRLLVAVNFEDPQQTTPGTTTVLAPTCGSCTINFQDLSATTTTTTDSNYKDYNYKDYNGYSYNDHSVTTAYNNSCDFFCNGAASGGTASGCYVTASNDRSKCINYFTGDDGDLYTLTDNGACASPNAGYYCCCEPKSGR